MNPTKLQTIKKAVLYCRVSTNRQVVEGSSLESQQKICTYYALQNGYEIVKIFFEEGESAKTADRTKLQELVNFCGLKRNKISAVIFYKIDRWARYMLDYHNLKSSLSKHGIIIRSATENLDDTPAGRFMENVLASQAQFDNEVRAERCAGGMREAMRQGRYVWMAPVGYKNIKIAGRATIAFDEQRGPLIREAFSKVAAGNYSIEAVRQMISKMGLLNKQGKALSKCYFYKLLTNPLYSGWIHKFGERHKGLFEPVVSDEIFELVQRMLKRKSAKHTDHKRDNPDFPLRRFIKDTQGRKLTGSWSKGKYKKYAYYRFGQKGSNFDKKQMEGRFLEFMDSYSLPIELLKRFEEKVASEIARADTNHQKERERLKKELEQLTEQQNILIQKNLKGVISDEILSKQLALIDTQLLTVNQLIVTTPDSSIDIVDTFRFLKPYLKKPSEIWLKSGLRTKIDLQKFQFPNGVVFDGKNFGTPELSILFKVKKYFSEPKYFNVDSGIECWNTSEVPNSESMPYIRKELVHLARIMQGDNPRNETEASDNPSYSLAA